MPTENKTKASKSLTLDKLRHDVMSWARVSYANIFLKITSSIQTTIICMKAEMTFTTEVYSIGHSLEKRPQTCMML